MKLLRRGTSIILAIVMLVSIVTSAMAVVTNKAEVSADVSDAITAANVDALKQATGSGESSSGYDMTIDFGYKDTYSTPQEAMMGEVGDSYIMSNNYYTSWTPITENVMTWQKNGDLFRRCMEHTDSNVRYVVLQSDQTETMSKKVWEPIEISEDVVLDLNGYEIKLSNDYNANGSKQRKEITAHSSTIFTIINGATLTIIDSSMKRDPSGKGTGSIFANGRIIDPYKYKYKYYTHRDIFHVDSGNLVIYGGQYQAGRTKVQKKKNFSWSKLKAVVGDTISLGVSIFEYASGIGSAVAALDDVQASFDKALDAVKEGEADVENAASAAKGAVDLTTEKQKKGDDDQVAKEKKQDKPTDDKKASSEKVDEESANGRNESVDEKNKRRDEENKADGKNQEGENKAAKDKAAKDDKNTKIYEAKKAVAGAALDSNKLNDMVDKGFKFAEGVAGLFGSKGAIMETIWGTPVKVGSEGTFVSYGGTYIGYGSDQLMRNATIEVTRPKNSKKGGKAYIYDGTFEGKAGANIFNITREARIMKNNVAVTTDLHKLGSMGYYIDENGARKQIAFILGMGNNDGRGAEDDYTNYVEGMFEDDPDTSCIQVRGGTFRNYYEHYNVGVHSVASGKDEDGNDICFTPYAGTSGTVNLGVSSYNENFIRDGRIQIIDTYGDGALVLMDAQDKADENVYHYRLYCGDTELRYKRYLRVYPTKTETASHSFKLTTQYRNQNTQQTGTALEGLVRTDSNGNVITEVLKNEDPLDDVEDSGAYAQRETFFYYPLGINNSHNYYVVPDLNDGTDVKGSKLNASSAWYYNTPTDYNGKQIDTFKYFTGAIYSKSNPQYVLYTQAEDIKNFEFQYKKFEKGEKGTENWSFGSNTYQFLTNFKWFKYRVYRVDPLTRENISESDTYGEDIPLKEAIYGTSTNSLRCKLPLDELGINYKPGEIYRIVLDIDEYLAYNYNNSKATKAFNTNLKTATLETSMLFMCYDGKEEIVDNGKSFFEQDYTPLQWVNEPEAGKNAKVQLVNGKTGQCDCNGDNIFDVYYQWYQVEDDGTEKMIAGTDNIFTGDILSNGTVDKKAYATKQYHNMVNFKAKGTYYNGQYISDSQADNYTYLNSVAPDDPNKDTYMDNGLPRDRSDWTGDMLHMYTHEDRVKSEYTKDGTTRIYLANNKPFTHNTDSCYIPESAKGKKVFCKAIVVNTYWQKNYPHVQVFRSHTLNTTDEVTATLNMSINNYKTYVSKASGEATFTGSDLGGLKNKEYITDVRFDFATSTGKLRYASKEYKNQAIYTSEDLAAKTAVFPNDFIGTKTLDEFKDSYATGRTYLLRMYLTTSLGRTFHFDKKFSYGLENQSGEIGWSLDDDGTLNILCDDEASMPNYTSAADYPWYKNKDSIKSVVVDRNIKNIGAHAFENYTNLKSLTIETYPVPMLEEIGEYAFANSGVEGEVRLPWSNSNIETKLGAYAFYNCDSLESISGIKIYDVPEYCFADCDNLKKVDITSKARTIGDYAFSRCSSLTEADSAESIGNSAFYSCTSLTKMSFTYTKTVEDYAFYNVPLKVVGGDKFESIGKNAFNIRTKQSVPELVGDNPLFMTSNANEALVNYYTNTILPLGADNSGKLGECDFSYDINTAALTVSAPEGAESASTGDYGSYLANTASGEESGLPWENGQAFIKDIVIEDGVTEIGSAVFATIQAKKISLPDSVKRLGYGAFSWNTSLEEVDLNKVETIEEAVFALTNLKEVTVPKTCKSIGGVAFALSSIKDVTILNPDCEITDSNIVFPTNVTIHAYDGSTAQKYVEKYGEERKLTFDTILPYPELSISHTTTRRSGEVTLDVRIDNNPGISSFAFDIDYPEGLTLTNVEMNTLFSSKATGSKKYGSPYRIQWYSTASENEAVDGVIATLTFKVDKDAPLKKYPIKLTYDPEDIIDSDMNNVEFKTDNGYIYVKNLKAGDFNFDNNVNMKDIALLQKYLNGYEVDSNLSVLDVNGDGKVNMKDIVLFQQYLNGWEVELK